MTAENVTPMRRYHTTEEAGAQIKGSLFRDVLGDPLMVAMRNDIARVRDLAEGEAPHADIVSSLNRLLGLLVRVES